MTVSPVLTLPPNKSETAPPEHKVAAPSTTAASSVQNKTCALNLELEMMSGILCVLRYETSAFFDQTTENFNAVSCGNQTARESTEFTSLVQQVLMNLQTTPPKRRGLFAATKAQLPENGSTIYAFAQCTETITQNGCLNCLNTGYNNILTCFPNSDGKAFAAGCFMRYSSTSFFPDNFQTIDVTPLLGKQGTSNKGAIVGGVVGGVILVLILIVLFACIRRPKCTTRVHRGDIIRATKLKGLVTYSYKDLKFATDNFSEENKLGEGGFGAVYKGTLRDGKEVAVKKLTLQHSRRIEEDFESEVMLISEVDHPNLVQLLGWCSQGRVRILVYEYMKNNSLDKFLFDGKKGYLNWKQRYDIILGIARGLTYLHEEFHVRIIHRDIKTNNILLDNDLQPRIADFGLARLLPEDKSHLSTKFAGTLGYTAPEYAIHGQLSEKVDVYSYGVVILEIITGQRSKAIKDEGDTEDEFLLPKAWKLYEKGMHLELVDKTLDPNDYDAEEVKKIIEIALLCTQAFADLRPTMSEVIGLLQNSGLLENIRPSMPLLIVTD
ncbi:cold-responsive protein kinase 1-like isoform X2 [Prosopis cineraria]|uniref:cold-responsive protein kinase 1-like isoform X2 n=1 Tax=Prosopis cineraria TaxID=364024 RepID=UPI00240F0BDD|nr:cold-responsive protein kinase 1-like isoform X2 [Prosopis cineraria]